MKTFLKDPDAILDWGFDWTDWLDSNEEISTSTWDVPSGITKDSDSDDGYRTMIWLSGGGEAGEEYLVTNEIVTDQGRTENRSFYIRMKER